MCVCGVSECVCVCVCGCGCVCVCVCVFISVYTGLFQLQSAMCVINLAPLWSACNAHWEQNNVIKYLKNMSKQIVLFCTGIKDVKCEEKEVKVGKFDLPGFFALFCPG